MYIKHISIAMAFIAILFTSCKKNETTTNTNEKGSFRLEFENQVNGSPLTLNSQNYTNANGDTFQISVFKYYVSNVTLYKADGTAYKIPESYLLIDASKPASLLQTLKNVPAGDYTKLSFIIGVDQERNTSGAQVGALDPINGMFWTWNSGYIFVKMEGTSPQSTAPNKMLTFHIGGIVDPNITIRTFTTDISSNNPLRIREDKNPQLHFTVDVATLFKGKQTVNFADLNTTMGGTNAVIIANNYVNGLFKLDHIHN